MATEEEKKRNLIKMTSLVIHGLGKGLWDMLGEAANATTRLIGSANIEMLQKEMGFEISGEDPQDMLIELQRLFIDELGAMDEADAKVDGNQVEMTCKGCKLMRVTSMLLADGIPPFTCPFSGMVVASMEKNLGLRTRIVNTDVDQENRVCVHKFEIIR